MVLVFRPVLFAATRMSSAIVRRLIVWRHIVGLIVRRFIMRHVVWRLVVRSHIVRWIVRMASTPAESAVGPNIGVVRPLHRSHIAMWILRARDDVVTHRPAHRWRRWPAMIVRGKVVRTGTGHVFVLHLHRSALEVALVVEALLFWSGTNITSPRAIETYPAHVVVDHLGVIDVMNHGDVHARYGRVVKEVSMIPAAAHEANAAIAESIVNSTVEANVRPPVACVP